MTIKPKNKEILDYQCLICLESLTQPEIDYWEGQIEKDKDTVTEPTIRRISCIKCAKNRNKIIPIALEDMIKNYKPKNKKDIETEPQSTPEPKPEQSSKPDTQPQPEPQEKQVLQKKLI